MRGRQRGTSLRYGPVTTTRAGASHGPGVPLPTTANIHRHQRYKAAPTVPRLLAAFIDAAERDPALAGLHADLTRRRREPLLVVLARGHERGQLPIDLDLASRSTSRS
jgi:hypothetical protein